MEKVIENITLIVGILPLIITALVGVLTALVAFFLLIPGDQPEKFLQSCVDFLAKFSAKKDESAK
jgi:hypothetical protein